MSGQLVAGIMTGTSVDGVDVALVRLSGTGRALKLVPVSFDSHPIPDDLRQDIMRCMDAEASDVVLVGRMQATLARLYAGAITRTLAAAGLDVSELHVIGSHGQTVYHEPPDFTLQLGDPSMLAHFLGVQVVGDFRTGDVACGGQGAPLVPYAEWCLLTSDTESRVLLNLGGIANVTILPAGTARDQVQAFDTGPANCLIDGAMQVLFGRAFDEGGAVALSGTPSDALVDAWLTHPYFHQAPPKSTGRELFSTAYLSSCLAAARERGLSDADTVATITELTVRSVARAVSGYGGAPDLLALSGGGARNQAIVQGLTRALPSVRITSTEALGMHPDAKEAICFAILAHEALQGVATGMPSVTGADRIAFQGKICPVPA